MFVSFNAFVIMQLFVRLHLSDNESIIIACIDCFVFFCRNDILLNLKRMPYKS